LPGPTTHSIIDRVMADRKEPGAGAQDRAPRGTALRGAEPETWYFAVRLGESRYAFDAPLVTEVVRLGPITRLPAAPPFLRGVVTHRGEILPVLDLGELLLQRSVEPRPGARAALVHADPWRVAVVVDAIDGLMPVKRRHLLPPPPGHGAADMLQAVAADDEGEVAVLDLARLVAAARARSVPA
jgi:purine-binding chemotaxis protein CheW